MITEIIVANFKYGKAGGGYRDVSYIIFTLSIFEIFHNYKSTNIKRSLLALKFELLTAGR